MNSRRYFLRDTTLAALALQWSHVLSQVSIGMDTVTDEVDWAVVRQMFPIVGWDKRHFNSGSAGVMPTIVSDYLQNLTQVMNQMAPYEAWALWQPLIEDTMVRLASMIHTDPSTLQLVRNTTEALNMIIYGIPLSRGDEVLIADHDYPYALNAWHNRAKRDLLQCRKVSYDLPTSDEDIVQAYSEAITPRTRVMHITYMTHRQGHILPVTPLTKLAKQHDIQVVIDGAHTLAHIPVNLQEIGCDYYATSLHKWLNAPHGTGLLYVQPSRITSLLPHPSSPVQVSTIDKYGHLGTRAFQHEVGISAALDFYDRVGGHNKYQRLQELKHYWTSQLQGCDRIKWYTDLSDHKSCSVVTIGIDGLATSHILRTLSETYDIHAKSVGSYWGSGVRISPNIFTSFEDLDQLVSAFHNLCKL